jgi:hypothetical protein
VIHRLRRRHRRIWLALAVVLPLVYVLALAARRPPPVMESLPEPLAAVAAPAGGRGAGELNAPAELAAGERSR